MEATSARPAGGRTLMAAHAANALGDGSFHVTAALFFTRAVGLSVAQTGLCLTIAWTAGFLLTAPLGQLADRIGLRRSAIAWSALISVALFAAAVSGAVGAHPALFTAIVAVYAVGQSALGATRQALVATLVAPEQRVAVRARLHVAVNTGLGVGAGLGGAALLVDTTPAYCAVFVFDAVTFLVAAAVTTRLPEPGRPAPAARPLRLDVLRDRPYVCAAALNAVMFLYMPTLTVALPLFIAQRTAAPGWTIALLFVVNTVGVLALQVRAARTVSGSGSAARALRRAGLLLLACCLAFSAAALTGSAWVAVAVLVGGALLQVTGEVVLAAGSWHVGFALADPDRPGQWQGLYASGQPLARAVGPVALTALLLDWSGPGWLVLGAVFAAAGLALGPVTAWGGRARAISDEARGAGNPALQR
jgi:MFS family permease